MAYQMIHMAFAYEWIQQHPGYEFPQNLILGSVAPDSVHMSDEFQLLRKIQSHAFEGCGEWSRTQDHERWKNNIISLWKEKRSAILQEERSFLEGICMHCLMDYCNDLCMIEMKMKFEPVLGQTCFYDTFRKESFKIDQWLYHHHPQTKQIMDLLETGSPFSSVGLRIDEIEKQKYHLLEVQYHTPKEDEKEYVLFSKQVLKNLIDQAIMLAYEWNL